jgi:hypothetical protein
MVFSFWHDMIRFDPMQYATEAMAGVKALQSGISPDFQAANDPSSAACANFPR